ncbi:MAG: Mur ligase family protein [Betaproteobacteria bacterium]
MRYRLKDIPAMLGTPAGRRQVADGVAYRLWPAASRLARLYRCTIARRTRVVAVVGSFGKSTTTRAIAAAVAAPEAKSTTANAWTAVAQAVLRIRPSQRHAVIEVGIGGPGQMEPYARLLRPDLTVVTSIGSEHHETLGSLDVTRAEKARMVSAMSTSGIAVLNGDDPNVLWMTAQAPGRVIAFGFGAGCDVRAEHIRLDWPHGTRFRLDAFGQQRELAVRLIGRQMIYPVLAAIAVALAEGVALDDALSRIRPLPPTRAQWILFRFRTAQSSCGTITSRLSKHSRRSTYWLMFRCRAASCCSATCPIRKARSYRSTSRSALAPRG